MSGPLSHGLAVLREAVRVAVRLPVPTLLTLAVVGGMACAGITTAGRAEAAEQAVLAAVDAEGTRSIVVRARTATPVLDGATVAAVGRVHEVETVVGFSEPRMVTPLGAPRTPLPLRTMVVADQGVAGPAQTGALASPAALDALGMADGHGTVVDEAGAEHAVRGFDPPAAAAALEPLLVTPVTAEDATQETLATMVVVVDEPSSVAAVTATVVSLLDSADPADATVETSQTLVDARRAVAGELTTRSRADLVTVLAGSFVLVLGTLSALVAMRRRDYGRRRALGASRTLVWWLVEAQTAVVAAAGSLVGVAAGVSLLGRDGAPLPSAEFCVAVAVLSTVAACAGAAAPALFAATRDPLHELRTP